MAEEEGGQRRRMQEAGVCDWRAGDHKRGVWRGRRCEEEWIGGERRWGEGEGEGKKGQDVAMEGKKACRSGGTAGRGERERTWQGER